MKSLILFLIPVVIGLSVFGFYNDTSIVSQSEKVSTGKFIELELEKAVLLGEAHIDDHSSFYKKISYKSIDENKIQVLNCDHIKYLGKQKSVTYLICMAQGQIEIKMYDEDSSEVTTLGVPITLQGNLNLNVIPAFISAGRVYVGNPMESTIYVLNEQGDTWEVKKPGLNFVDFKYSSTYGKYIFFSPMPYSFGADSKSHDIYVMDQQFNILNAYFTSKESIPAVTIGNDRALKSDGVNNDEFIYYARYFNGEIYRIYFEDGQMEPAFLLKEEEVKRKQLSDMIASKYSNPYTPIGMELTALYPFTDFAVSGSDILLKKVINGEQYFLYSNLNHDHPVLLGLPGRAPLQNYGPQFNFAFQFPESNEDLHFINFFSPKSLNLYLSNLDDLKNASHIVDLEPHGNHKSIVMQYKLDEEYIQLLYNVHTDSGIKDIDIISKGNSPSSIFNIYPNPIVDQVTIATEQASTILHNVRVYDMHGRVTQNFEGDFDNFPVSLSINTRSLTNTQLSMIHLSYSIKSDQGTEYKHEVRVMYR